MSMSHRLCLYLEDRTLIRAREGRHNFIAHVQAAAEIAGWPTTLRRNSWISQRLCSLRSEFALFHMQGPIGPRSLTIRRAYVGAFWNIETQSRREHFEIAGRVFDPDEVPRKEAQTFRKNWLKWAHERVDKTITSDGYIFVPLQARLFDRRSWQHCTPTEMLEHVVATNPERKVVVTLHPRVSYTDAERRFVRSFCERHPAVTVSEKPMAELLETCDAVATMNSAVAFHGLFFRKPAVLFADADFHHIARKVDLKNPSEAFRDVTGHEAEYSKFLYWFLKMNTINGGRDTAPLQILDRLGKLGWPL